ncbi:hypothetical protein VV11_024750 [Trichodesmium erythraeum 21-75]|nr:hypothetical protein [Trichodesmium erythraeum 21-75]
MTARLAVSVCGATIRLEEKKSPKAGAKKNRNLNHEIWDTHVVAVSLHWENIKLLPNNCGFR